eukprot:PhF_6_TR24923/c0_g1_i1/m.34307
MFLFDLPCVVWLCACANFLNQADRTIMSFSIVQITERYSIPYYERGWILSSFTYGYILTQTLAGPACIYTKSSTLVLRYAVFVWSIATIMTPIAIGWIEFGHFAPLYFCRWVMGAAEGFCWPAAYHAINTSVSPQQRTRSSAILVAGGNVGQLVAVFMSTISWSSQFWTLGAAGILWVFITAARVEKDSDAQNGGYANVVGGNDASLCKQYSILLRHRGLWAAYVAHFCNNFLYYMYFIWMPTYMHEVHGMDPKSITILALPLLLCCLCGPVYGVTCDYLVHEKGVMSLRTARVLMTTISLLGGSCVAVALANVTSAPTAIILYCVSAVCTAAHGSGYMANHADIVPYHTSISFGLSNTFATIPGLLMGPIGAKIITNGRWDGMFYICAVVGVVGSIIYGAACRVDTETKEIA